MLDVALAEIAVGDTLVIYPHEICPADGVVIEGHGTMDESYLTGEPCQISKTSDATVISGAINGESALTIRTSQLPADSRYAKIMEVMRESESKRPQLRRLGDPRVVCSMRVTISYDSDCDKGRAIPAALAGQPSALPIRQVGCLVCLDCVSRVTWISTAAG